jgi:hypothetical protein
MKTKTKLQISQSALRDYYNPACCRLFWKEKYLNGFKTEPTDAMKAGLYWESKLLTKSRDGQVWEFPKLKSGEPSKIETDMNILVGKARELFTHLQIDPLEIQPVWEVGDLLAHPDLVCSSVLAPKAIVDVKYCGYADTDRFSPWFELNNINTLQAVHYTYMYNLLYNEWVPFFYLVFFKNGGVRLIDVKLTVQAIDNHKALLNQFRQDVERLDAKGTEATFSQCVRCPLNSTCAKRVVMPKVEELVV